MGSASVPADQRVAVLIVDDHPLLRRGLAHLIDETPRLSTCAEVAHPAAALESLETENPQVAVVDLNLVGGSGLELIREMRRRRPGMGILVLSMLDETVYAERALRAGAGGYIMKGAGTDDLLQAIATVAAGRRYLSDRLRNQPRAEVSSSGARYPGLSALTDREFEVFELVGRGHGTRAIAQTLSVSVKTVETHRHRIKDKLDLKDGNELVHLAIRWIESRTTGI